MRFLKSQLRYGWNLAICDRGLILFDMFGATTFAFITQFMLWRYAYDGSEDVIRGFTLENLLFYYAFVIGLGRLNNGYEVIEGISYRIINGSIEPELVKPVSYAKKKFFEFLGSGLPYLPLVLLPAFIYWGFERYEQPLSLLALYAVFPFILILTQLVCFQIAFTISLLTAKTEKVESILNAYSMVAALFGGVMLPPQFWPESFQPVMEWNPFAIIMAQVSKFIVEANPMSALNLLLFLLFWACIGGIACKFSWLKFTSQYKGVGG